MGKDDLSCLEAGTETEVKFAEKSSNKNVVTLPGRGDPKGTIVMCDLESSLAALTPLAPLSPHPGSH